MVKVAESLPKCSYKKVAIPYSLKRNSCSNVLHLIQSIRKKRKKQICQHHNFKTTPSNYIQFTVNWVWFFYNYVEFACIYRTNPKYSDTEKLV